MRTIKFRAWNGEEMCDIMEMTFSLTNLSKVSYITSTGGEYGKMPILMQFTGLMDKNGVPIYEGDVVEILTNSYSTNHSLFVILYSKRRAQFLGLSNNGFIVHKLASKRITVKGNIYENPEL